MKFIRSTLIGGIFFLIPFTVLVMILGKTFTFFVKLTTPFKEWWPLDRVLGIAIADLIAIAIMILLCFLAGLFARSKTIAKFIASLESRFLNNIPGYTLVKSMTGSVTGVEQESAITPILARFDDASQVAFKIESLPDGRVIVYIPGAPDPWAGSLFVMAADRVEPLECSLQKAVKNIRGLGAGSSELFAGHPSV
ncbi:MAG: DUF502 domain-containing protein [Gammaproteobacteria bacterium]|nr:DUF502 domain-containing protein [Gammaproteobacteria bacterium]